MLEDHEVSSILVQGNFTDQVKGQIMELRPLVDEIVQRFRSQGVPEGLIPVALMLLIAALSEEAGCINELQPFEGVWAEHSSGEPEKE